jgi:hypothetical protein
VSASPVDEPRKVSILLVGESPHLFSFLQPPLEKIGCQCHFAESHQEVGKILSHTKLDIVLSLSTLQSLSEMTAVLAGSRITMFHMLSVEERCWWLPVLRNGENCLGTPALRSTEFARVLAEIVKTINRDPASSGPSGV